MTPNITRFPPIHPMNLFLRKSELTHFDNFGLLYGGVKIDDFFGPSSDCNHSGTVCLNHLKFAVQVVLAHQHADYGPLWIKISSDSDKRFPSYCSWKLVSPKILAIYLQFPVRLDQTSNGNYLGTFCLIHLKF